MVDSLIQRVNEIFTSVFLQVVDGLFGTMQAFADQMANRSVWASILFACLGIRAAKALIEILADSDGMESLVAAGLRGAVYAVLLIFILDSWSQVQTFGWRVAAGGMAFAGSIDGSALVPEGSTGREIVADGLSKLFGKVVNVFTALYEIMLGGPGASAANPDAGWVDAIIARIEAMGKSVFFSIIAIIPMLAAMLFVGLLMYEVLTSALMVAVALMFGPVAVAFHPLVPTWTQNTIGLAASGIARLVITVFLAGAAVRAATTIVLIVKPAADKAAGASLPPTIALLTVAVLLILMAASVSTLTHFSGSIFSSVSGSLGFGRGTRSVVRSAAGAIASADKSASRAGGGGRAGASAQIGGALNRAAGRVAPYKAR